MVDHRSLQTPVRNQGDRPTCVGFAVSAAHEWLAGDVQIRSAEDAMWAAHQAGSVPGREETTVSWALDGLSRHEHASEPAWPYGNPCWFAGRPAAALDPANRRALPPWSVMRSLAFDDVAVEVNAGKAVVLTIRVVPAAWYHAGSVIDADVGAKTPGNHAVLAVGVLNGPDQIIIKNSWGPNWGHDGYGYVTRRYLDTYLLGAHTLEGP